MEKFLSGRALLAEEIKRGGWDMDEWVQHPQLKKIPAIQDKGGLKSCYRCGNQDPQLFAEGPCSCSGSCFYCLACLQMGQIRSCSILYQMEEINAFKIPTSSILSWQGQLSDQQSQASKEIIQTIKNKESRLIWAVAGAGKTEMLFEGIAYALSLGQRLAVVSPRVDVCLELAPRLQAAFEEIDLICMHGQMEEDYRYCPLTVATTHQMLRFKQAFDCLIVDEVDAFPYHNNQLLEQAVQSARKEESCLIYLSATPDHAMQKQVQKKELLASILPARYHGHPLPEVQMKWAGPWSQELLNQPERSVVFKKMKALLKRQRRFLIFLPNIQWMEKFERVCRDKLKDFSFEAVHSIDPNRHEKVMKMRAEELDFLMTTTILERGVTFKNIDVLVLGADDRIFTESSLVQIAGRAGRSADFPKGEVIFYHQGQSRAMKRACQQIINMNRLAQKRGLLHG